MVSTDVKAHKVQWTLVLGGSKRSVDLVPGAKPKVSVTLETEVLSVVTEMTLQSTGRKFQASLLSSLKSGVIFIPLLFILADVRGLSGIQEAQPLTNILVLAPCIYYMKKFFQDLV